jgi:hypothetical protein
MHGTATRLQERADEIATTILKAEKAAADARESFHSYRQYMRPTMLQSWWTQEIADALQQFYLDVVAGKRPRLAIGAPPQHGKSWAATDFIAWVAGKNPDFKTIYASYSGDLGIRTNLELQRTLMAPKYQMAFPNTRVGMHGWVCNTDLIEFAGHTGSFRNTTIEGQINGMELHLGVIDDPVKGRAEASSKVMRERVWNWFTDDWGSRLHPASRSIPTASTCARRCCNPGGRRSSRTLSSNSIWMWSPASGHA